MVLFSKMVDVEEQRLGLPEDLDFGNCHLWVKIG